MKFNKFLPESVAFLKVITAWILYFEFYMKICAQSFCTVLLKLMFNAIHVAAIEYTELN